jgi:hypothetical protein
MLQRVVNRTLSWLLPSSMVFGIGVGFVMGRQSAFFQQFQNVDFKEACKPIPENTAVHTQGVWRP